MDNINTVKFLIGKYWVLTITGILGIVRDDFIGTLALIVTVLIFIRQTKDSKERDRVEKYRRNPYFSIEIETLMDFGISEEVADVSMGIKDVPIREYVDIVNKEISERLDEMEIDMTNIGFNWAKDLGVKYKIEVREEYVDEFNKVMIEYIGTDGIRVTNTGGRGSYRMVDSLGRGVRNIELEKDWSILSMYSTGHSGKGQEYKIEPTKYLLNILNMEEKLSTIAEYVSTSENRSVYIPRVYDIKLKIIYVNADEEEDSIKCDIYYGLKNPYARVNTLVNKYREGSKRYWYRYMFERKDKYDDFLRLGEEKLKRLEEESKDEDNNEDTTEENRIKLEYEPLSK